MDDTLDATAQGAAWLLFIHQVPPRPDYLRVKVRRRLQRVGAVALKSTVYVLPNAPAALEDLQWVRAEILAMGGSALICEASFLAGVSDEEVEAMWRGSAGDEAAGVPARPVERVTPGQTWVTRQDVFIDRMASAWLILRFIDAQARFRFVPARGYRVAAGELRFDMYDAEYTHEGEDCTFQTLVRRFGLVDAALSAIGEIVCDIDCKAERFQRPETAGVARLVHGVTALYATDEARIERASTIFDELYAALQQAP